MKTVNIGIIGAGRIGKVHAATLAFRLPQAAPVAITDVNSAAAEELAAQCRIPRVAASAAEIFADKSIDAVLICSSTDTHASLVVEAARPASTSSAKSRSITRSPRSTAPSPPSRKPASSSRSVSTAVSTPTSRRVRQAVAAGEIGTPHLLHIISRDPAPPPIAYVKVSGGMFLDMMIHDFDMARFLIGDEVEEVYTAAAVRVDPEIGKAGDVDTAVVDLALPQWRHRHH